MSMEMAVQIGLLLLILLLVGGVNLLISEPLERSARSELLAYLGVVGGGIAGFTMFIVCLSLLFQ